MQNYKKWKLIERKRVYDSKFIKVYEDKVKLPGGTIIDNYTVVEKPSIAMVVATDKKDKVIILDEYKYAAGETLLTLPAGHKKEGEKPVDAAKRELLEETGYVGGSFEEVGVLYDYPTKDLHKVYVVRAKDVMQSSIIKLEETEIIKHRLVSVEELRKQIKNKEWKTSSALAAMILSGILF